jgi:ethanolamine utilization protein EutN
MRFGRVIGTLVATQKYTGLEGVKFLVVQLLDRNLKPQGDPIIAADGAMQAGPGELVFVIASREAAMTLENTFVPVDHAIAGIVDQADILPYKKLPAPNIRWSKGEVK